MVFVYLLRINMIKIKLGVIIQQWLLFKMMIELITKINK